MSGPRCFFRRLPGAGPCEGRLVRCHVVDRQLLAREFPYGVELDVEAKVWRSIGRHGHKRRLLVPRSNLAPFRSLESLRGDPRAWVWGCGGAMGLEGHHGRLDGRNLPRLVLPRERLPAGTEELAVELGLEWWLDRRYGPLSTSREVCGGAA